MHDVLRIRECFPSPQFNLFFSPPLSICGSFCCCCSLFKLCHHLAFSLPIFLLLLLLLFLFARIYYLYARKSIVIGKISLAQFILTTYFSERNFAFHLCVLWATTRTIRCVSIFNQMCDCFFLLLSFKWNMNVRCTQLARWFRRRVRKRRLFIQMHPQ